MLKKLCIFIAAICLSACNMRLDEFFDKSSSISFIDNTSETDVTIQWQIYGEDKSIRVEAGEEIEIPDTYRWELVSTPEWVGEVQFVYGDKPTVSHKCSRDTEDKLTFTPAKGNIMDPDSWTRTNISGRKYRHTFSIK